MRKADKETNPGSSKDVPPQTGMGHHACKPILAVERLKQDCGELEDSSGCRTSSPVTRSHRTPTASRSRTVGLFPLSPRRAAGKAAAQRSAGRRASRPGDRAPRPPSASPFHPPRPAGPRRSSNPGPRRPGLPHLASEAPGEAGWVGNLRPRLSDQLTASAPPFPLTERAPSEEAYSHQS